MKLNRSNTMKRAFEFAHVRHGGQSSAGRFLVLGYAPLPTPANSDTPSSRFGIIVTKKVGNAVVRNRLRRQLREIIRAHADSLEKNYRVVIIIRHRANFASYSQLEDDFCKCLRRLLRAKNIPQQTTARS